MLERPIFLLHPDVCVLAFPYKEKGNPQLPRSCIPTHTVASPRSKPPSIRRTHASLRLYIAPRARPSHLSGHPAASSLLYLHREFSSTHCAGKKLGRCHLVHYSISSHGGRFHAWQLPRPAVSRVPRRPPRRRRPRPPVGRPVPAVLRPLVPAGEGDREVRRGAGRRQGDQDGGVPGQAAFP